MEVVGKEVGQGEWGTGWTRSGTLNGNRLEDLLLGQPLRDGRLRLRKVVG